MKKPLFSKSIFKQSIRSNWILWLAMTLILCITVFSVSFVVDTMLEDTNGQLTALQIFTNAFFEGTGMVILLIYIILVGNKLVASEVDRGYLSFTLNTPTTRRQIILTKLLFLTTSIVAMVVVTGLVTTLGTTLAGVNINLGRFWIMSLGFTLFMLAIGGICFFASCFFNRTSHSLLLGAGLPLLFYIASILSNISGFEFLQYFTINSLFRADSIADGASFLSFLPHFVALAAIASQLYIWAVYKFTHKDLPL